MANGGKSDVLGSVDELEARLAEAPAVPFSDQVRIEREELFEILDRIRAAFPVEAKDARRLVKQREELMDETRRECERLLESGWARAERERSEVAVERLAERQAAGMLAEARRVGRGLRYEVDEWLDEILETLEANLDRFLEAAQRGRERIHERSSKESVLESKAA
jgi:cell division septum initiation protein DivIVA